MGAGCEDVLAEGTKFDRKRPLCPCRMPRGTGMLDDAEENAWNGEVLSILEASTD